MSFAATLLMASLAAPALHSTDARPFTLQQVLSAPYATELTASPRGNLFAWVEDVEGRHNLWVSGSLPSSPSQSARQLTHNTQDDAQDISQLAWAPDASAIAYVYGAPSGANGRPANPAHLQRPTPVDIILQPLAPGAHPTIVGEGHAPVFTHDGRSLLFIHDGQVWITDTAAPSAARQLVYDRGSATSLTLSPDDHLLAFISHRSEANQPSHSFLALYDLNTRTLRFLSPSTSDDSAPVFSPDGSHIAWLRSPFVHPREFAAARTSPTPWSIQLADLTGASPATPPAPSSPPRPTSPAASFPTSPTRPPASSSPPTPPSSSTARPTAGPTSTRSTPRTTPASSGSPPAPSRSKTPPSPPTTATSSIAPINRPRRQALTPTAATSGASTSPSSPRPSSSPPAPASRPTPDHPRRHPRRPGLRRPRPHAPRPHRRRRQDHSPPPQRPSPRLPRRRLSSPPRKSSSPPSTASTSTASSSPPPPPRPPTPSAPPSSSSTAAPTARCSSAFPPWTTTPTPTR